KPPRPVLPRSPPRSRLLPPRKGGRRSPGPRRGREGSSGKSSLEDSSKLIGSSTISRLKVGMVDSGSSPRSKLGSASGCSGENSASASPDSDLSGDSEEKETPKSSATGATGVL